MDWVLGAVIVVAIIAVCAMLCQILEFNGKKIKPNPLERDAEIIALKGEIKVLESKVEVFKDRGDRYATFNEKSENRLAEMHKLFADIVRSAGEQNLLKEMLKKYEPNEPQK